MNVKDRHVVVTGGANGFGRELARGAAAAGARAVTVLDIDAEAGASVANEVDGLSIEADVSVRASVAQAIDQAEQAYGPVEVYFSNAGTVMASGLSDDDDEWLYEWGVHLMAHVFAARILIPRWVEAGHGHLVITASGVGLVPIPGDAAYSTSKAAAVSLAQLLAITHGHEGVRTSVVCPGGMRTALPYKFMEESTRQYWEPTLMEPSVAAAKVLADAANDVFMIFTHDDTHGHYARMAANPETWVPAMQRSLGL